MRNPIWILGVAVLCALSVLGACNDDPDIDTRRDTADDPLGGIVGVGTTIYATNDDRSGHAGSQVSLFSFDLDGLPAGSEIPLEVNGYGYLAMADNGQDLLLQAHGTGRIFGVSRQGTGLWTWLDVEMADAGWRACGLGRRPGADHLVALYTRDDHAFIARTYDLALTTVVATTAPFTWASFPATVFPRALTHDGTRWVVLVADADGANATLTLDDDYLDVGAPVAEADGITGLTVASGWLYAAYDDGTIAPLRAVAAP